MNPLFPRAVATGLVAAAALPAFAQTTDANELAELRARIAEIESRQSDWAAQRRAQDVQAVVQGVHQDAELRSTMLADATTAGYDGKFFLSSPEGDSRLNIGGQFQFRWVLNNQSGRADETEEGFMFRRARVSFNGELGYDSPVEYVIVVDGDRGTGDFALQEVGFKFPLALDDADAEIVVGKFKLPFLRQELVSSKRQTAVERGLATEFFTLDFAEQVGFNYTADSFRVMAAVSDGADSETTNFGADNVVIALTARGEMLFGGSWKQNRDHISWVGDDQSILVGAAVHYEIGDDDAGGIGDYLGYTVDASYEQGGIGVFGSLMGGTIDGDGISDADFFGGLVEASYNIDDKYAPFIRYEFVDADAGDTFHALTVGSNVFLDGHKLKFTGDVVYIFDGDLLANPFGNSPSSSGLGLSGVSSASDDGIFALRLQMQVYF